MNPEMKKIFDEYNIEEETKFFIDSYDFDKLIRKYLGKLIPGPKYENFESIAEFEWNNYSNYDADVTDKDLEEDGMYDNYYRDKILNKEHYLGLHQVLCFLVENKILPYGSYEVKVSW